MLQGIFWFSGNVNEAVNELRPVHIDETSDSTPTHRPISLWDSDEFRLINRAQPLPDVCRERSCSLSRGQIRIGLPVDMPWVHVADNYGRRSLSITAWTVDRRLVVMALESSIDRDARRRYRQETDGYCRNWPGNQERRAASVPSTSHAADCRMPTVTELHLC